MLIGTSMRCSFLLISAKFTLSFDGDDMQLFDAVEIINDTEPFLKGEKGYVVKVIDNDNVLIYL